MTKYIPLTKGKFALVDDADFDWLNQWKWSYLESSKKGGVGYAVRHASDNHNSLIFMHRLIFNAPSDMQVDHWDRDGINNQRDNLRFATHAQNTQNQAKHCAVTSRFKGVSWHKSSQKWQAGIRKDGRTIYLGCYANEQDAAAAYNSAARTYFGEFAYMNELEQSA